MEVPFGMTGSTRRRTLILVAIVMLFTMLVAAGLPRLELQPGMPPPSLEHGQVVAPPAAEEAPALAISINKFIVILIVFLCTGAALYWAWQILRGATWKSVSETIRPMLIAGAFLLGLSLLILLLPRSTEELPVEMPTPSPEPLVTSPLGAVPLPLLWLVGIGLFVMAVLVGVWIFTSSRRAEPIELVGLEAEKARQALLTGSDLKDVIMTCYREMSRALKKDRGIEREPSMTTGEFETRLEAAGIPREPIHQLTRLFDAVRYGNRQPSLAEKQEAIQCLEDIMRYSRQAAGLP
jgi:hypothetical protein